MGSFIDASSVADTESEPDAGKNSLENAALAGFVAPIQTGDQSVNLVIMKKNDPDVLETEFIEE